MKLLGDKSSLEDFRKEPDPYYTSLKQNIENFGMIRMTRMNKISYIENTNAF